MTDAYIYQADIYCSTCGQAICDDLNQSPALIASREDSDSYPQGPYPDGGGEADYPQHCGACSTFLQNPLTSDGADYVRDALAEYQSSGHGTPDILDQWRDFYCEELES